MTGLSARQLQWWDARRLFVPAIRSHRTEAGGFTERRYTPVDVLELQVLADLRRRGFSVPQLRRLLATLRDIVGESHVRVISGGIPRRGADNGSNQQNGNSYAKKWSREPVGAEV